MPIIVLTPLKTVYLRNENISYNDLRRTRLRTVCIYFKMINLNDLYGLSVMSLSE